MTRVGRWIRRQDRSDSVAWQREHGAAMHHDGSPHVADAALMRRHYADVVADNERLKAENARLWGLLTKEPA